MSRLAEDALVITAIISWVFLVFCFLLSLVSGALPDRMHRVLKRIGLGCEGNPDGVSTARVAGFIALGCLLLWTAVGQFDPMRVGALIATGGAGFAVGSLIGFLFFNLGDRAKVIERLRDLILGTLAGATFASFGQLRLSMHEFLKLLGGGGPDENYQVGLLACNGLLCSAAGFFLLFWICEFVWNKAQAANQRDIDELRQAELQKKAGPVLEKVAVDLSSITKPDPSTPGPSTAAPSPEQVQAGQLLLNNPAVAKAQGAELSDTTLLRIAQAKLATGDETGAEADFRELLRRNAYIKDAVVGLANILEDRGNYLGAATIIESHLDTLGASGRRWLGYYLLWVPDRLNEAVRFNQELLNDDPHDLTAKFNLACALAQLYGRSDAKPQEQRQRIIKMLQELVAEEPGYKALIQRWSSEGGDFSSLGSDPEFRKLIE